LGISYYAGSQWRVAARKPKGLAAMVPWEGENTHSGVELSPYLRTYA